MDTVEAVAVGVTKVSEEGAEWTEPTMEGAGCDIGTLVG